METGWFTAPTWGNRHYFYGNTHSACGRVAMRKHSQPVGDAESIKETCGICGELAPLIARFAKLDTIKEQHA